MNYHPLRRKHGNALFLILIAVVLFAGLSYAVTRSFGGRANISRERMEIGLAELDGISSSLSAAITKLRATGCAENEISFELSGLTGCSGYGSGCGPYTNPSAPADGRCHVFLEGGADRPRLTGLTDLLTASPRAFSINTDVRFPQMGTNLAEIFLMVKYVNNDFCTFINRKVGITGIPLNNTFINSNQFKGDFFDTGNNTGSGSAGLPFCVNNYSANQNIYVQVLMVR